MIVICDRNVSFGNGAYGASILSRDLDRVGAERAVGVLNCDCDRAQNLRLHHSTMSQH